MRVIPTARRIAAHVIIVAYLLLSLEAFTYTMFRRHIGMFPWPLAGYFYAMMAPYQGYMRWNFDFLAQGKRPDGTWEMIDLLPYYPSYSRGQRNIRQSLLMVRWKGERQHDPEMLHQRYKDLARLLQQQEARQGRPYDGIRLWRQDWPMSHEGYEALREPIYSQFMLIAELP
jgi:hypothetical protein